MGRVSKDAVRKNEQRLRMLPETAPEAIVLLEDSGKILFWNCAATDLFGYHSKEAIGMPYASLVRDRYRRSGRDDPGSPAEEARPEGTNRDEKWAQCKDGAEILVETSLAAWELQGERLFTDILHHDLMNPEGGSIFFVSLLKEPAAL